jgi:hypothetical protein
LGEWRYSSIHSLISALVGGEWSPSCIGCFTRRERAPDTHLIGCLVGLRAILDAVVKREIPSPCQESKPRTLIIQPVAQCYTDWAIMALFLFILCYLITKYLWLVMEHHVCRITRNCELGLMFKMWKNLL